MTKNVLRQAEICAILAPVKVKEVAMKVAADALWKDFKKLSVDELIEFCHYVQNFSCAPELKQEALAKIQKRALTLMDRLNKQPNILADYETAEKLVNAFGEYNHERKLIYPVAHSLKIKIRKAKYYLQKEATPAAIPVSSLNKADAKVESQNFAPLFTAEEHVPAEELSSNENNEPNSSLQIRFTGNMDLSGVKIPEFDFEEDEKVNSSLPKTTKKKSYTNIVAPYKSAVMMLKQKALTLKEKSQLLKEKTAPMRAKISAGLKDAKHDLGEEMKRWQTIAGAAVILLSGFVIGATNHAQNQRNAEQKVRKAETPAKKGDEKTFTDFQKVQKQQAAKVDTAAIKSYLNSGRA